MNNAGFVRSLNAGCYLRNDRSDFIDGQWGVLLGVSFEYLSLRPFDGEKVQPIICLPDFDGLDDVRVSYSCAVFRFTDEAGNSGLILA